MKKPCFRLGSAMIAAVGLLCLVPAAGAGNGHGGGGAAQTSSSSCAPAAPGVSVDNNYAWGAAGSWGMPGQQLEYGIQVLNYDVGCGSSSFTVTISAPSGFSVSFPTSTITLNSSAIGYVWAQVTAPGALADGDYPLTVSVQRVGATAANAASATTVSYYKVYSADTTSPTLFWVNPSQGQTISGRSYTFNASSSDDHAVKKIDLLIDGAYVTTASCDDVSYICQLSYKWSLSRAGGAHTATFRSYDWLGNVGTLTVAFTVGK